MIIYTKTKEAFLTDVRDYNIEDIILTAFKDRSNKSVGESELRSWRNSLHYMASVLDSLTIPSDSGIAIEFTIPRTSNRIDFIIAGEGAQGQENVVIVELKQWEEIYLTEKDAMVKTRYAHGLKDSLHPSYQAWSYAALLTGFNETIYSENIQLQPCAFLHNHTDIGVISHPVYADYLSKAPVFFKEDKINLRLFIASFIHYGDKKNTILRIEGGRIRPSKSLADSLQSMLKGNPEFILIDSQKEVYEEALMTITRSGHQGKHILIIHGGPGTGKSVVAINLLAALTRKGLLAAYVTKNSAPRTVYESKLTGHFKKTEISNFFSGSGAFTGTSLAVFDALIVDEAHRLNEKSGLFGNLGENQIKEIIDASKASIFFLDERQRVTFKDIGSEEEILKWARKAKAQVTTMRLRSQFRCGGSDGYLSWLDKTLQITDSSGEPFDRQGYEFKIFDDPSRLKEFIIEKNKEKNKARLVAGYCWDWKSKKTPNLPDIVLSQFGFEMKWNLATYGMLWIVDPDSVHEMGCIHTCQGLEVDYIGVIVGGDFLVRDGIVKVNPSARSTMDKSIQGYKNRLKDDPERTLMQLDQLIKNTYRTLMTRGLKGCYVYCTDQETQEYFKKMSGYYHQEMH